MKWKTCSPPNFFAGGSCLLSFSPSVSLYACMKQIFLTKEDIPSHIRFFKHKHVAEEAKMLIKLIAVDSNYFKRYKSKITQYISTIILDNEKLSINEVLEVLTGVGPFASTNK